MTLGAKLKKLREQNNVTQKEIAKYLGVSVKSVNAWENNEEVPIYKYIWYMAEYYHANFEDLVDKEYRKKLALEEKRIRAKNIKIAIVTWSVVLVFATIYISAIVFFLLGISSYVAAAVGSNILEVLLSIILVLLGMAFMIGFIFFANRISGVILDYFTDHKDIKNKNK